jgi:hypothetical protein
VRQEKSSVFGAFFSTAETILPFLTKITPIQQKKNAV